MELNKIAAKFGIYLTQLAAISCIGAFFDAQRGRWLLMAAGRQPVVVRLTPAQALRMERMGEPLWPTEKLSAAEVTRRMRWLTLAPVDRP
jgi:hypothetical protein